MSANALASYKMGCHKLLLLLITLMYALILQRLYCFECQVDVDVDNAQCCGLVNVYGVYRHITL